MPSFWMQMWHQFVFTLADHGAAVFLGTLAIGTFGFGPIGRALAARLRGSPLPIAPTGDASLPTIKASLDEMLERLDFSERVLAELHSRSSGVTPSQLPARTPREVTPV